MLIHIKAGNITIQDVEINSLSTDQLIDSIEIELWKLVQDNTISINELVKLLHAEYFIKETSLQLNLDKSLEELGIESGCTIVIAPTIQQTIDRALQGITNYLNRDKSYLKSFARFFQPEKGQNRAKLYSAELSKLSYTNNQKAQILYALLSSKNGPTLKEEVKKAIGANYEIHSLLEFINQSGTLNVVKEIQNSVENVKWRKEEANPFLPGTIWEKVNHSFFNCFR